MSVAEIARLRSRPTSTRTLSTGYLDISVRVPRARAQGHGARTPSPWPDEIVLPAEAHRLRIKDLARVDAWHGRCTQRFYTNRNAMGNTVEINEVVRALACYLRLNPQASDTTEGIRLWWFNRESEVAMDRLLPALAWMIEHHFVEPVAALDGHLRYRRIASDFEIDALLQGRFGA